MNIVVLAGGDGPERSVSLVSGRSVAAALRKKHHVTILDPEDRTFLRKLLAARPDCVFVALHGGKGESGVIQGFLETLGLPYTGSGVLASALCMNKILTKKILLFNKIPTPKFLELARGKLPEKFPFSYPAVVKPACLGSTIGITVVRKPSEFKKAVKEAYRYDNSVFVEQFIAGTEITIGLLGNDKPIILPPIEIRTERALYDFTAKYEKGCSVHIIPPQLPETFIARARAVALKTYQALGCAGCARMEIIVTRSGNLYVLDVNTIPGFTSVSLLPDAARHAGIPFDRLCEMLIDYGLERCGKS